MILKDTSETWAHVLETRTRSNVLQATKYNFNRFLPVGGVSAFSAG